MFFKKKKDEQPQRRKEIRELVQIPVLFTAEESEDNRGIGQIRGIIVDVSKKGLLILKTPSEIKHPGEDLLKTGARIKVKFHLPANVNEINAEGIIEHITEKDEIFANARDIGIKFAHIAFTDIMAIEDFIRKGMDDGRIKNKRKFARLDVDLPVVFSDINKEQIVEQKGVIINLSATGLLLAQEKDFLAGRLIKRIKSREIKTLDLEFRLVPRLGSIKVKGEICRITYGTESYADYICLGINFTEIKREDQLNIVKFVALCREKLK